MQLILLGSIGVIILLLAQRLMQGYFQAREARQRLSRRNQFLTDLLDKVDHAVVAADLKGQITYWNSAAEALFGWPAAQALNHQIFDAHIVENLTDEPKQVMAAARRGENWSGEFRVRRKDGLTLSVLVTTSPIFGDNGRLVGFAGISFDIAERKQREREMEAMTLISTALRSARCREEMIPIVVNELVNQLGVDGAALATLCKGRQEVCIDLGVGAFAFWTGQCLDARTPLITSQIRAGGVLISGDVHHDSRFTYTHLFEGVKSAGAAALTVRGETIGFLLVGCTRDLTAADERVLITVTDIAANALYRSDLHERTRRNADQLVAVEAIGRALAETLDLDEVYQRLADAVLTLLSDVATVIVSRIDRENEAITCVYCKSDGEIIDPGRFPRVQLGRGPQSEAIKTGRPVISNDLLARMKAAEQLHIIGPEEEVNTPQSALFAPMLSKGQAVGVIQVQSYTLGRFDDTDQMLMTYVANAAAIAIENAVLFDEVRRHDARMAQLVHISERLNHTLTVETAGGEIGNGALTITGTDRGALFRCRPAHEPACIWWGGFGSSNGVQGTLAEIQGLLNHIYPHDSQRISWSEYRLEFPHTEKLSTAYLTLIPLVYEKDIIAVLACLHDVERKFSVTERETLGAFSRQAAIALQNAYLYEELQDVYMQTVVSLARAMDARDTYTSDHSQRLAVWSSEVARRYGLSEQEVQSITWAAQLHDIGKIGVPDAILRKPGPLTPEEWDVLRRHPLTGEGILEPLKKLTGVAPIVGAHHERFDGDGYPRGLKGDAIPIGARILAVVDAYGAITDERVYRKARGHAEALAELQRCAGGHFDPAIVEIFLSLMEDATLHSIAAQETA